MNLREDSLKVVADLQSASLDRLAEEGYARRRAGDLARLLSEPSGQGRRDRHLAVVRVPRGRVLAAAGAVLAAAAVAAAVILVPSAPRHPAAGPGTQGKQGTQAAGLPAILLTAAHVAAGRPMATGTYWYVKERDFEPTAASVRGPPAAEGHAGPEGAAVRRFLRGDPGDLDRRHHDPDDRRREPGVQLRYRGRQGEVAGGRRA